MVYLNRADKGKPGETRGHKTDRPKMFKTKEARTGKKAGAI